MKCLTLTVFVLACLAPVRAQNIVRPPEPDETLNLKWAWAQRACPDRCVVGYSIQRMMHRNSFSGWRGNGRSEPTLQSLVYGREVEPPPSDRDDRRGDELVNKELAFLFRFDDGTLQEVDIVNISLPVSLDGHTLVWLGLADHAESIRHLEEMYASTPSADLKEDLVSAVGMHGDGNSAAAFLRGVIASDVQGDVREDAVFWYTESQGTRALPLLESTARTDADEDVREAAVFGISRIESDKADDVLIALARGLGDRGTREEAVFWLGQKASDRAVENLEDIAANDPDAEIQKRAVFAISELPTDDAVPRLISIARTHANPKIRHEAIFWLGESGDERAVEELARIVRGEP